MNLYTDLLSELGSRGISYEQEDQLKMVMVENGYDTWLTIEIWKDGFTGGTCTYNNSDNSYNFTNAGCPDFDNVEDAVDWVVN